MAFFSFLFRVFFFFPPPKKGAGTWIFQPLSAILLEARNAEHNLLTTARYFESVRRHGAQWFEWQITHQDPLQLHNTYNIGHKGSACGADGIDPLHGLCSKGNGDISALRVRWGVGSKPTQANRTYQPSRSRPGPNRQPIPSLACPDMKTKVGKKTHWEGCRYVRDKTLDQGTRYGWVGGTDHALIESGRHKQITYHTIDAHYSIPSCLGSSGLFFSVSDHRERIPIYCTFSIPDRFRQ